MITETMLKTFDLYGVWDFKNLRTLPHHHAYARKNQLANERIAVLNKVNWRWRPHENITRCLRAIDYNNDRIKEMT